MAWSLLDFTAVKRIGIGAFGSVYLMASQDGRQMAVKVSHQGMKNTGINNEIEILKELNHPNIVTFYRNYMVTLGMGPLNIESIGFTGDTPVYSMEYFEGVSVENIIKCTPDKITDHMIKDFCIDVTSALMYMKTMGIIHRDLKPANIMQTSEGGYKIIDFGLSIRESDTCGNVKPALAGTPFYAPSEVLIDMDYSFSMDVFAFGVCLYRLVTKEMPFPADGLRQLKIKLLGLNYNKTCIEAYDEVFSRIFVNQVDCIEISNLFDLVISTL